MNKKTSCITDEQFDKIVKLIYTGSSDGKIKPSEEIALMLTITGNSGLRIGDCTKLKMNSFIRESNNYKYNIIEEKKEEEKKEEEKKEEKKEESKKEKKEREKREKEEKAKNANEFKIGTKYERRKR